MGVTIAHETHAHHHLPWRAIAIILAAVAVAVAVLVLVDQPWERQSQTTPVSAVTAAGGASAATADMPKNRSAAFRAVLAGETPPEAPAEASMATRTTPHWPRHTEP